MSDHNANQDTAPSQSAERMTAEQLHKSDMTKWWSCDDPVTWEFAEAYAEHCTAAITKERDKYKRALENHLCKYDLCDWLACSGGHNPEYCTCCETDKPHEHQILARAESAESSLLSSKEEIEQLRCEFELVKTALRDAGVVSPLTREMLHAATAQLQLRPESAESQAESSAALVKELAQQLRTLLDAHHQVSQCPPAMHISCVVCETAESLLSYPAVKKVLEK